MLDDRDDDDDDDDDDNDDDDINDNNKQQISRLIAAVRLDTFLDISVHTIR